MWMDLCEYFEIFILCLADLCIILKVVMHNITILCNYVAETTDEIDFSIYEMHLVVNNLKSQ